VTAATFLRRELAKFPEAEFMRILFDRQESAEKIKMKVTEMLVF